MNLSGHAAHFEAALAPFSAEARSLLRDALERSAWLDPDSVSRLLAARLGPVDDLARRLVPVARAWAHAPVSGFLVGAVARCVDPTGATSLVLGCNIETEGLGLTHTIHAEQAAAARAFHTGAARLVTLAVSAAPCGHCRQFLTELSTTNLPDILLEGAESIPLGDLLPRPFGPADLGVSAGMLDAGAQHPLALPDPASRDPLVAAALDAARRCHAPDAYARNPAGVALDLDGVVVRGSTLQSAALNPSLSPMHVARINLHLGLPPGTTPTIGRAVLVERVGGSSQESTSKELLAAIAPDVTLEVHRVTHP